MTRCLDCLAEQARIEGLRVERRLAAPSAEEIPFLAPRRDRPG